MSKVAIFYKGKTLNVSADVSSTVADVKKLVASQARLSVHRLELRENADRSKKDVKKYVDDRKTLQDYGVKGGEQIAIKDLGPQFSYRGVFIVEYLGPILIMLAFALRPAFLFGAGSKPVDVLGALTQANAEAKPGSANWNAFIQSLAIVLWVLHFVKRELETLFVHKFSRGTMPLFNLFKNSMYYWGFALAVGFPLVNPAYQAPANKTQVLLALGLWAASQATNLAVHLQLAGMRPAEGSQKRDAPGGFLFSLVSCPNYTAEVLGWVAWSLLTQVSLAYAFTLAGFLQMAQWALAKHRGYKKADDKYSKLGRKAIVPFLL